MSGLQATPLRVVLERLAAQLHRLAAMSGEIEEAVGHDIAATGGRSGGGEILQSLDDLVQSLAGLSAYVDRLGQDMGLEPKVNIQEAVAAVRQRSLATALAGQECEKVESGSADFF
ncbi:hypothetical protein [Cereibacter sphaeroides]|uniref:hypothetical protein n=1 Tax=Cereibacter sphaeroides TaxID=1063 RepID=UPI0002A33928|nr:hypothetical protein [Cereibacter sphaeroides]EKX58952.1 hypothetical protein D516_4045 [Rhodobacter sp. AKP1]RIA01158.1 hypothetical protein D1122_00380 [Cereibacter sphaeroides]